MLLSSLSWKVKNCKKKNTKILFYLRRKIFTDKPIKSVAVRTSLNRNSGFLYLKTLQNL